jgi:hypothetical protein
MSMPVSMSVSVFMCVSQDFGYGPLKAKWTPAPPPPSSFELDTDSPTEEPAETDMVSVRLAPGVAGPLGTWACLSWDISGTGTCADLKRRIIVRVCKRVCLEASLMSLCVCFLALSPLLFASVRRYVKIG